MVIDSYGTKQEEAEEKVQKALGIQDDPYEIVTVDESLRTGEDGVALESYSQMAFTTKVSARAVDVLIGSEDYMDGFEFKDEYFYGSDRAFARGCLPGIWGSRMTNTALPLILMNWQRNLR